MKYPNQYGGGERFWTYAVVVRVEEDRVIALQYQRDSRGYASVETFDHRGNLENGMMQGYIRISKAEFRRAVKPILAEIVKSAS